jgi:hypothetical protein
MKIIAITPDRKTDCVTSLIIEGLYDLGIRIVASAHGNNVRNEDVYNDEELIEHSRDADYIFAFFGKVSGNSIPKYYLLDQISRPDITAYIDGSEWTATGHPENWIMHRPETHVRVQSPYDPPGKTIPVQALEAKKDPSRCKGIPWINEQLKSRVRWYFKRECYPEDVRNGILPLNVGCSNSFFGKRNDPKSIDIFCSFGHLYTGLRHEINQACLDLKEEGFNVEIVKGISHDEYIKKMTQSYISVSAWGAGNSCMRMWESMANNACCFAQRTEILFPNKPLDGYHYVEYSTPGEFYNKIKFYLNHKELCIDIGRRAHDFVLHNHTGKARVKYMLDVMKNDLEKTLLIHG